jgi:hypothetical protein
MKIEKRLAGAYLPQQAFSYLELYSSANQITKSQIIRMAVDEWIREKDGKNPVDDLVKLVTARKQLDWNRLKQGIPEEEKCATYNSFVKSIITEFQEKGIEYPIIKKIAGGLQI